MGFLSFISKEPLLPWGLSAMVFSLQIADHTIRNMLILLLHIIPRPIGKKLSSLSVIGRACLAGLPTYK